MKPTRGWRQAASVSTTLALCAAVSVAPLHASAGGSKTAPSSLAPSEPRCAPTSGEDLFRGLFFGTGPSSKLAEALTSKAALEATQQRRSRLTVAQTQRLLSRQQEALKEAGKTEDANVLGGIIEQLEASPRNKSERLDARLPAPSAKQRQQIANNVIKLIKAGDPEFFERFSADLQSGNPVRVDRALSEGMRANFAKLAVVSGQSNPTADDDGGSGHGVDQDSSVVLWLGLVIVLLVWVALPVTTESLTALSHDESVARLSKALRC